MTLLFLESNFNQPVITRTSSTSCTVIEYWSEVCRRSLWPPLMLLMYFQTSLCLYFSTPNVYFPKEKSISSMVRVLLIIQNPNCVCRSTSYVPLDRVFSNIIILPRCNVNGSSQTSLFSKLHCTAKLTLISYSILPLQLLLIVTWAISDCYHCECFQTFLINISLELL